MYNNLTKTECNGTSMLNRLLVLELQAT